MSVTINKAEGVTVFTVKSNPKSKYPLLCQILGTLCCSSICSVSVGLQQKLKNSFPALGTAQIMIGLINLSFGAMTSTLFYGPSIILFSGAPFWLGGMFIIFGIICITAQKFSSPCLVAVTVMMNIISGALAITAIVMYSVDLGDMRYFYNCSYPGRQYDSYRRAPTSSSDEDFQRQENYRMCQEYLYTRKMLRGGLEIMMIVLSVLQLCIAISCCVLSVKALCKNKGDEEDVEDPELHKPLMDEELSNSTN